MRRGDSMTVAGTFTHEKPMLGRWEPRSARGEAWDGGSCTGRSLPNRVPAVKSNRKV